MIDKLDIPRAHIFGVSMGGMIAQEFALRHPKRTATLTLGCTTAGGKHGVPPPPESLKILTAPREGVSPADVIRRGWPLGHTPKYIAEHRDVLEAAIPRLLKYPTPPFAFQRQLEATYTLQTYDRLPQIKAPTLVVTGAEDVLIPAKNSEIIASQIAGAKLHIIPDVGHAFMDARDEFLRVFVPFVKSHPMGASGKRSAARFRRPEPASLAPSCPRSIPPVAIAPVVKMTQRRCAERLGSRRSRCSLCRDNKIVRRAMVADVQNT